MAPTTTWWCEHALVDEALHDGVTITAADGRFTSITGADVPPPGAVRLTGLTVPGMANAHSHAFHRALRSRTQLGGGSFWTWRDVMYRAAARLDPDRYQRLARAVFAEMAMAGITCVGEFHYLHHGPGGSPYGAPNAMGEALLTAAGGAGIRITLLDTLYLHGGFGQGGYTPLHEPQRRFSDVSAQAWAARVDELDIDSATQRLGAAIHSVRAVDPAAMRTVADWAAQRGAVLHVHASEQPAENEGCLALHARTPIELLDSVGALGARTSAVHATHLGVGDISLLANSGTTVCLCPTTERDLGDGIGPSTELAATRVPMSLGSDSHAVIDLFEEARAVELDERLRSGRRGAHATADLWRMATTAGHRSLSWDDAGTIAVGARADLVTIRLDSVRTAGAAPSLEAAVFAASAADVTDVVVDGRTVVRDGAHLSIDAPAELRASITDLLAEQ